MTLEAEQRAEVEADLAECLRHRDRIRGVHRRLRAADVDRTWRATLAQQIRALDRWIARYRAAL